MLTFLRKSTRINPPSPGSVPDSFHGLKGRKMTPQAMKEMAQEFVVAARRAKKAGVHGVELHSSNGYFFTQCISSAANDRTDEYRGEMKNRFRFWKEVIEGIKNDPKTKGLPLIVKLSAIEDGSAIKPWARRGNTVDESIQVAQWAEEAGPKAEAREHAVEWLRSALASSSRPAKDLFEEAHESAAISKATLNRARKESGITAFRHEIPSPQHWRLPDNAQEPKT